MQKNIGSVDRTVRIVAGAVILLVGYLNHSWWGLVGLAPLATAFIGWCPLYAPFGFKTCSVKKA
ncbi:DUF2892 domain-containing protein [candidate division KSB1 bacterium]|nr:DUF2892 domain-containing protein [candidate division KSB1 bacterium]